MNRRQQVAHILKKDVRQRWLEIASVLALTVLLVIASVDGWQGTSALNLIWRIRELIEVLLAVTWCVLIARVVQGESLPGREQLWLTRPYDRLSLVLAKLIFVVVFAHVPLIVAQVIVLTASEMPFTGGAMFVSQIVLIAVVSLPALVIATLTRSLGQFMAVSVGVVIVVLVMLLFRQDIMRDIFASARDARLESSWTSALIAYSFLIAVLATACAWQYRTRQTRVVVAALAAGALFAVMMLNVDAPGNLARVAELQIYGNATGQGGVELGRPETELGSMGNVTLRFHLTGLTDTPGSVVLHDWQAQLTSESGHRIETSAFYHGGPVVLFLSPEQVAQFGSSRLNVSIDYVIETVEDVVRREVSMDPFLQEPRSYDPVRFLDDGPTCSYTLSLQAWSSMRYPGQLPTLNCYSSLKSPNDWHIEMVDVDGTLTAILTEEKTSPPLAINPIVQSGLRWNVVDGSVEEFERIERVPVIVRRRASLERRHAEYSDIVLTDLIASD